MLTTGERGTEVVFSDRVVDLPLCRRLGWSHGRIPIVSSVRPTLATFVQDQRVTYNHFLERGKNYSIYLSRGSETDPDPEWRLTEISASWVHMLGANARPPHTFALIEDWKDGKKGVTELTFTDEHGLVNVDIDGRGKIHTNMSDTVKAKRFCTERGKDGGGGWLVRNEVVKNDGHEDDGSENGSRRASPSPTAVFTEDEEGGNARDTSPSSDGEEQRGI